jgi:DeoR family fructose operon transcriptional repressor
VEWSETKAQIVDVFADVAFMSSNGISVRRGLTTPTSPRPARQALIRGLPSRRPGKTTHKFGRGDFARVAPLSVVDTIITDVGLDVEFAEHPEPAHRW